MEDQNKPQPPVPGSGPVPPPASDQAPGVSQQPPSAPAPALPQQPVSQPPVPPATPYPQQPVPPATPYPQQPASPGAQPYGQPGTMPYGQPVVQQSGKAIGALVCGICAILFAFVPVLPIVLGIVALVLASKAIKEAGKNGKTTGAKVCGIIGIALSVLWGIAIFSLGLFAVMLGVSEDVVSSSTSSSSSSYSSPIEQTEDEKQAEAATVVLLEQLKTKDAAVVQDLAVKLDADMKESTDYSLTELGIDPAEYATWLLTDLDYTLDGVYTYDSDGTGTVYADIVQRDSSALIDSFSDEADTFFNSDAAAALDLAGAKAKLGELFKAAMQKSTVTTDSYISVDLVKKDGAWVVDQESWTKERDFMFSIY